MVSAVATDSQDQVYALQLKDPPIVVFDRENHRIQVFSADGDHITMWADVQRLMDISIDSEGAFYVSEGSVNGSPARVSILDGDGKVLSRFNCRGSGHGS